MIELRKYGKVIVFVVSETEENENIVNRLKAKLSQRKSINNRDVINLIYSHPKSITIKKIKLAIFSQQDVYRTIDPILTEYDEHYNTKASTLFAKFLKDEKLNPYLGYYFKGLYEFGASEKNEFVSMLAELLNEKTRNVIVFADDTLLYLMNQILDSETIADYGMVNNFMNVQKGEYTEQIAKLVSIDLAKVRTGSVFIMNFASPLLRINDVKSSVRAKEKKKGLKFVDFDVYTIAEHLGIDVQRVESSGASEEEKRLMLMTSIIFNEKVSHVLDYYVDMLGLYGASQLTRGFTEDPIGWFEDVESKLDLFTRGFFKSGIARFSNIDNKSKSVLFVQLKREMRNGRSVPASFDKVFDDFSKAKKVPPELKEFYLKLVGTLVYAERIHRKIVEQKRGKINTMHSLELRDD